jgi:hypothetical protein
MQLLPLWPVALPTPLWKSPAPPPSPRQGGFTWVTIIMGVLMGTTGMLVLVLRAWVMHDGGLPSPASRVRSEISRAVLPSPAGDEAHVVGKGARGGGGGGRAAELTSRAPGSPKADRV